SWAGCATRSHPPKPVVASPNGFAASAIAAPAPQPTPDPITDLIALSNHNFESRQRELPLGPLAHAKTEFNRALEVLLESPFGARSEPRIREHFDRLVEKISAYEMT